MSLTSEDWKDLSLAMGGEFPPETGEVWMDAHNAAIVDVQQYILGRAQGTDDPVKRRLLLELRVDLNQMHHTPDAQRDTRNA